MSSYYEHTTKDGERWDTIAYDFYGDPTLYEGIIAANPTVKITPMLDAGTRLKIPVIDTSQSLGAEELPPWKR